MQIDQCCKLLAKKVNTFTLSGFSAALLGVTMLPDVLNNLSNTSYPTKTVLAKIFQ